jgi:hypothetical protein
MNSPSLALQAAVVCLGLDEHNLALDWLHKACDARGVPGVHWLKVEPIWDVLRPDPGFGEVLKRLRLAN